MRSFPKSAHPYRAGNNLISGHEESVQRRLGHDAALLQPPDAHVFEEDLPERSVVRTTAEKGNGNDENVDAGDGHRRQRRPAELIENC